MKRTKIPHLILILLLAITLKAIPEPDNNTQALTCPNARSLNRTSLNSPNRIDVSEFEQGICTRDTQRTFFQGDLNIEIHGHPPFRSLRRTPDRIPGARANLTETERRARESFVELFRKHRYRVKPHSNVLYRFATKLDTFFFSGSLTSGREPILLPIEPKKLLLDIKGRPLAGRTRLEPCYGDGHIRMQLSLSRQTRRSIARHDIEPEPLPLIEILGTLVHEMAHAYTFTLACQCRTCVRHVHQSIGHTFHGEAWERIYKHMQSVVNGWDPAFNYSMHSEETAQVQDDGIMWRVYGHKREKSNLEEIEKSCLGTE